MCKVSKVTLIQTARSHSNKKQTDTHRLETQIDSQQGQHGQLETWCTSSSCHCHCLFLCFCISLCLCLCHSSFTLSLSSSLTWCRGSCPPPRPPRRPRATMTQGPPTQQVALFLQKFFSTIELIDSELTNCSSRFLCKKKLADLTTLDLKI